MAKMRAVDTRGTWFLLAWATTLVALSVLCLGFIELRIAHTGNRMLTFLGWNLFLAWCPVGLAFGAWVAHRLRAPLALVAVLIGAWLLFLPNAPYLVTDMIHVRISEGRLQLFDAAMLATFGLTGVALAYASIYLVHGIVRERVGARPAWFFIAACMGAAAVGVYLGRILRLNSWDAIQEPTLLPRLVAARLEDPLGNPALIAFVVSSSVLLLAGYMIVYWSSVRLSGANRVSRRQARRAGSRMSRSPQ